jgi:hypothetical protein
MQYHYHNCRKFVRHFENTHSELFFFFTCRDVFQDGVDRRDADVGENAVDAGSGLIPRQG